MEEDFPQNSQNNNDERGKMVVTDPKIIRVVLHEQKMQILNILIHEMKNIQELREITQINQGQSSGI